MCVLVAQLVSYAWARPVKSGQKKRFPKHWIKFQIALTLTKTNKKTNKKHSVTYFFYVATNRIVC